MDPQKTFQSYSKTKLQSLRAEMEALLERLGYTVVFGKGDFKDGTCLVESHKKIVINRYTPLDIQMDFFVNVLTQMDLSNVYVLPAIRELIDAYGS